MPPILSKEVLYALEHFHKSSFYNSSYMSILHPHYIEHINKVTRVLKEIPIKVEDAYLFLNIELDNGMLSTYTPKNIYIPFNFKGVEIKVWKF